LRAVPASPALVYDEFVTTRTRGKRTCQRWR
jgi:hypothetical protein